MRIRYLMLISKKWLAEFVKLPASVDDTQLASRITRSTVEVEGMKDQAAALEHIVVGMIESVVAHPNADKLRICHVDVGHASTPLPPPFIPSSTVSSESNDPRAGGRISSGRGGILKIVCGGSNVAVGMKVAVALPGASVRWHGEGELVELATTKIRGEESEGMICAKSEIGGQMSEVGEDRGIIWDLTHVGVKPGTPLAEALDHDDVIFDIEHKSLTNRPDLMGHYGMAREVAVLIKSKLAPYAPKKIPSGKGIALSVKVDDRERCPRYMAVAVDGVIVGASPEWMQRRLAACGVRAINNVVDVTNYVMLELGQPMHAFDADVLGPSTRSARSGQVACNIVVRLAKPKEKITALDQKTYQLDTEMLLITNEEKAMAIAGVMGGEGSGVSEKTSRIVFESANFEASGVRKTSMRLGLRSESSARFEKALDPELCALALARAVELMGELCPSARVASNVVDVRSRATKPTVVMLTPEVVNARLGTHIPTKDMLDILQRLGFTSKLSTASKPSTPLRITVPSWRATKDIAIVEDVIEEIARLWGYDRIEPTLPAFSIAAPPQDPVRELANRLRLTLSVGLGVTETYRYAFLAPELLRTLGFDPAEHVKLANPLAQDRPYLCSSLVPNLFDTVVLNHRTFPIVSVFEVARVFIPGATGEEDGHRGTLPAQPYHLGIAYSAEGDDSPLVLLCRQVEMALTEAGYDVSFREMQKFTGWMHLQRAAEILVDGKKYGILAEATREVAQALGIDRRVAIAEMNLTMLAAASRAPATFSPIPQFPDVKRDIAFTVGERTQAATLEDAVRKTSQLLVGYELFDVYRGKGVEVGRKSVAVHLTFRSPDRTLISKEADDEMAKIRRVLEKDFGATIRA